MSLYTIMGRLLVLFTAMPIHEFAHAWAADKMGDNTAKGMGRLNINPFSHLDLVGSFLILLTGFGWAKPVPVDTRNFKDRKKGMAITAIAGPLSNIIMAFICMIVFKVVLAIGLSSFSLDPNASIWFLIDMISVMVTTNIYIALFNLVPVPPLDGFNVLSFILPHKIYWKVMSKQRDISMIFLLIILFTPIVEVPLSIAASSIIGLMDTATGFVFNIATVVL